MMAKKGLSDIDGKSAESNTSWEALLHQASLLAGHANAVLQLTGDLKTTIQGPPKEGQSADKNGVVSPGGFTGDLRHIFIDIESTLAQVEKNLVNLLE